MTLSRTCADFQARSALRRHIDDGGDMTDEQVCMVMSGYYSLVRRLARSPARSLLELHGKAEALRRLIDEDVPEPCSTPATQLAASIARDILAIAAQEAR